MAAVEPAAVGWQLAGKRVAASPVPVRHAGLDGNSTAFGGCDLTWERLLIP